MPSSNTELVSDKKSIQPEDVIIKYFNDIIIEVDGMRAKSMERNTIGINEHIAKINSALIRIRDAKLEAGRHEIY